MADDTENPREDEAPAEEADESVEAAVQEEAAESAEGEAAEGAAEGEPRKKVRSKKTRVVRRRKSKKEKERPLSGAVRLAVESGKVDFGSRTAMAGAKARAFVLAGNAQAPVREKVLSAAKAAGIPVIEFEGTSVELGSVCGRPFPVSVLSVYEEGSSNLLELAKKK
jgi:large subunit ribosomal protein L30e